MNTAPYEILAPLFTIYWGAVGATFPLIDAVPDPGVWNKIGLGGPLNYQDSDGVAIEHSQSMNFWRSLGDAGSRKVFRSEEDAKFKIVLVDMTLEGYRQAVNQNTVTSTPASAGVAGFKELGLSRGLSVATMALLLRAPVSPYVANGNSQYQIWIAAQSGNPKPVALKASPMGLELEWTALVDPSKSADKYFGTLLCQTADAET